MSWRYLLTDREAAVIELMREPPPPRYMKIGEDRYVHVLNVGGLNIMGRTLTRAQLSPDTIIEGE